LGGALLASPFAISSIQFGEHASRIPTGVDEVGLSRLTVSANTSAPDVLLDFRVARTPSVLFPRDVDDPSFASVDRTESKRAHQARGANTASVYESDARGFRSERLSRHLPLQRKAAEVTRDLATRVASSSREENEAASGQPILEYTTAAMGLVESVVLNADGMSEVTILGQTFSARWDDVSVHMGEYAVAAGHANGELAFLMPLEESYVPGASTVWVAGSVSAVDNAVGSFSIGQTSFDYTALLARNPALAPDVGDVVDMYGVQPAQGGSVLLSIDGSNLLSIDGSNGRSIDGSNGRSIDGSNGRSIDGSDGRSIDGSNGRSIDGSNSRSIDGSNSRSIDGSNSRSIDGSNRR
jgi:hypothetical protein